MFAAPFRLGLAHHSFPQFLRHLSLSDVEILYLHTVNGTFIGSSVLFVAAHQERTALHLFHHEGLTTHREPLVLCVRRQR